MIPAGTLALGDLEPALEGTWTVETLQGPVQVTTVFELVRKRAGDYTPEKASAICGVHPDNIRQVARIFGQAKPAMIFTGYRMCKWLQGDLLHESAEDLARYLDKHYFERVRGHDDDDHDDD